MKTFIIRKCNIARYLLSAGRFDHDDEVAMYTYWHTSTNKQSQQTKEETKVIQKVVSPEASKLNHAVMNKKKQGHQMQFSLEKRLEKRKWIHPTDHNNRWIVL